MSHIGNRIRDIRKFAGLSQVAFVENLGINQGHLSNIENGKAVPSDMLIKSICREWGIREEWLREGKGEVLPEGGRIFQKGEIIPESRYKPLTTERLQEILFFEADSKIELATIELKSYIQMMDRIYESIKRFKKLDIHSDRPKFIEFLDAKKEFQKRLNKFHKMLSNRSKKGNIK